MSTDFEREQKAYEVAFRFFFLRTDHPKSPSFLPNAKYSPWAYAIRPHCCKLSFPLLSRYCSETLTPVISARNIVWLPNAFASVTLHSRLTGHCSMEGVETVCPGSSVKLQAAILSTSRPLFTPQKSVSRHIAEVVRLMTNSFCCSMME